MRFERFLHIIGWIAQRVVGIIFVFAAVEKIVQTDTFAVTILRYQMVPEAVVNLIAIFLPWIELVVGMALLFGMKVRPAAFLAGLLMLLFTFAVASAWFRGLNIECGCFGSAAATQVSIKKLIENLGIFALTVITFVSPHSGKKIEVPGVE